MIIINEFIDWNLRTGYFDIARLHIKKQTNSKNMFFNIRQDTANNEIGVRSCRTSY